MRKLLVLAAGCYILAACNNQPTTNAPSTDSGKTSAMSAQTPPQAEFADQKYVEIGKQGIMMLSSGNVDGWMNQFNDNAMYRWSGGDSLAGKTAITNYWRDRRKNVIDSINFSNDIWLPMKINRPQRGPDAVGIWLLSWYQVNVKYKNGKKLMFWIHTDMHFDNNDKIDQFIQYMDRAPINAALAKK